MFSESTNTLGDLANENMSDPVSERIQREIAYLKAIKSEILRDIADMRPIVEHNTLRREQLLRDLEKSKQIIRELKG
ncbi:MAG: hypothetical protein QW597_05300 [Thermoplasmataceae archaeon]